MPRVIDKRPAIDDKISLPGPVPVLSIVPDKTEVYIKKPDPVVFEKDEQNVIINNDMAKGKLLGFLGKVGTAIGNVFPAAGVAGKLATNASEMIKKKNAPAVVAAKEKEIALKTAVTAEQLGGGSGAMAKLKAGLQDFWLFVVKYWWAFLPALLVLIYLLFFKSKRRTFARRVRRSPISANRPRVRRKKSAAPKGSAWARKMYLARMRKRRKK